MPVGRNEEDFRASITPGEWRELWVWRPVKAMVIGVCLGLLPSACLWCGLVAASWGH